MREGTVVGQRQKLNFHKKEINGDDGRGQTVTENRSRGKEKGTQPTKGETSSGSDATETQCP